MKLASFADDRVGLVLDGNTLVDVTAALGDERTRTWPPVRMVQAIADFPEIRSSIEAIAKSGPRLALSDVHLNAPVAWPNKVIAYPANYQAHIEEMNSRNRSNINGFFLKPNSSIIGPNDQLVLPDLPGFPIHHECELAVFISKEGRSIPESEAMDYIFGYSCLIDATVRGPQERVMRKSYDSFTPIGPYIVTADEVRDPDNLRLELWVNDGLRQHASTKDLILSLSQMISLASSVATLMPGDIIATGTPAGVGPIVDGDVIRIRIEDVGEMSISVIQGSGGQNVAFSPTMTQRVDESLTT
jgi:2-keto-4-pentenoate hydratase/2-oxohepta-3-ene-1,7-dioic acid hydratase in catechol pathway